MEQVMEMSVKTLSVLLFGFIMVISIISHITLRNDNYASAKEMIRRSNKQTLGGRIFFYCLMIGSLNGFIWGWSVFMHIFMLTAILTERLIVYRVCRGNKDKLGKLLVRINW